MRKTIILLAVGVLCVFQLSAQTEMDALRYSQIYPGGTARSMAMGGAFGALGGDFSCLSMNPAGIALYRKGEFTFTPSLTDLKVGSTYLGTSENSSKYNFNLSNLGLVGHLPIQNASEDGWQNLDFGIGYNRQHDFNGSVTFSGINKSNSLLNFFTQQVNANGGTASADLDAMNVFPFDAALAYWGYLINPIPGDSLHYNHVLPYANERQQMTINTNGSMGEMVLSMGGNYANKFYFGATMGIDYLYYHENSIYSETNTLDSLPNFRSFNLNRTLSTSGTGINLKLGMIYRASDWMRLGLAFHTPTLYNLHDDYSATLSSNFYGNVNHTKSSPNGSFDYTLTTPFRLIGSVAFIINTYGVISLDYEFVDYTSASFSSPSASYSDVNNVIQQNYAAASNLRIGTEWRVSNISLRAGYALFGTPFSSNATPPNSANQITNSISGGIGFKEKSLYLDLGYIYSLSKQYYQPYYLNDQTVEGATLKLQNNAFVMTIGYRF